MGRGDNEESLADAPAFKNPFVFEGLDQLVKTRKPGQPIPLGRNLMEGLVDPQQGVLHVIDGSPLTISSFSDNKEEPWSVVLVGEPGMGVNADGTIDRHPFYSNAKQRLAYIGWGEWLEEQPTLQRSFSSAEEAAQAVADALDIDPLSFDAKGLRQTASLQDLDDDFSDEY